MKSNCHTSHVLAGSCDLPNHHACLDNQIKRIMFACLKQIHVLDDQTKKQKPPDEAVRSKLKVIDNNKYKIIAYPDSDLKEILSIMDALQIDYVPIVKHPWKKELVKVMDKNEIEYEIRKANK